MKKTQNNKIIFLLLLLIVIIFASTTFGTFGTFETYANPVAVNRRMANPILNKNKKINQIF